MSRKTLLLILVGIATIVFINPVRLYEERKAANIVRRLQNDLPYCTFESANTVSNVPDSWITYKTKEGLSFAYPPDLTLDNQSLVIHTSDYSSIMEINFEPITPVEGDKENYLSQKQTLGETLPNDLVKIDHLPTSKVRMRSSVSSTGYTTYQDLYLAFPEETCLVQVSIRPHDTVYKDLFEKIMGTFVF